MEMDFDTAESTAAASMAALARSQSYTPRLRHAMFRFNWPTSELLFGQYFSMFCEWYAESAEDGPLQMTGTPTARLAQIRFTQKFLGDWTVAGLIGDPNQATVRWYWLLLLALIMPAINNGQSAETPQVQGKVTVRPRLVGKGRLLRQAHPLHGPVRGRLAAQCPAAGELLAA